MKSTTATDVEGYIATYPATTQRLLKQLRKVIRQLAPEAEESISYQMPAYKLKGPLVYFGVHNKHIGFYPTPSAVTAFQAQLKDYTCSKGAIQFPLDKPLPLELIRNIVSFRVDENKRKADKKKR